MILWSLGMLLILIGLLCSIFVLLHAFRRSIGTGLMVLCVPCYVLYYAFSQFEHRFKGMIVAGYIGCLTLGTFLEVIAARTV